MILRGSRERVWHMEGRGSLSFEDFNASFIYRTLQERRWVFVVGQQSEEYGALFGCL
jgi:hypothetical protein